MLFLLPFIIFIVYYSVDYVLNAVKLAKFETQAYRNASGKTHT